MMTHGLNGDHKMKVRKVLRGGGYKLKHGGAAYSKAHDDEEQDKKLIESSVSEHKSNMNPGRNYSNLKTLKSGGVADGEKSHARADKSPRKAKHGGKQPHTKINIMVAPGKSGAMMPPALPAIGAMPPRPPMAAPALGAPPGGIPGMPMGVGPRPGMPPMAKHGGKLKSGGRTIGHYTAGAASGIGREEKVENYKKNVKKG